MTNGQLVALVVAIVIAPHLNRVSALGMVLGVVGMTLALKYGLIQF